MQLRCPNRSITLLRYSYFAPAGRAARLALGSRCRRLALRVPVPPRITQSTAVGIAMAIRVTMTIRVTVR